MEAKVYVLADYRRLAEVTKPVVPDSKHSLLALLEESLRRARK